MDAGKSLGTLVGNLNQPYGSSIFVKMTEVIFIGWRSLADVYSRARCSRAEVDSRKGLIEG